MKGEKEKVSECCIERMERRMIKRMGEENEEGEGKEKGRDTGKYDGCGG